MAKSIISGFVFYRGPSMLDDKPIVAILTGLDKDSRNVKTGNVLQTWILRSDIDPVTATHTGDDASICGACPHRGILVAGDSGHATRNVNRSCYVTVFQAPLNVYKTFHRDRYPTIFPAVAGQLVAGQNVRLGSYGDPAAVPLYIWSALLAQAEAHEGYTHQWRNFPELAQWCMASCDNAMDREHAKMLGFRTFRVRGANEIVLPREVICPASKEANHKTTCNSCKACGGTTSKAKADIVIMAHGVVGKINAFNSRVLVTHNGERIAA